MSDTGTVDKMIGLVERYGLNGQGFVSQFSAEQLAEDFNGIGPEWFPDKLRAAIDELHEDLLPVAFVHDVRWSHSDGTHDWFAMSNDEFEANGRIVADEEYGWYDPRRYIRRRQAKLFANLCRTFGWSAYEAAYEKAKGEKA